MPFSEAKSLALKDLETIPGVGKSLAGDLFDLGLRSVRDLQGLNPQDLYERLCTLRGCHQDRCVLYVFRCAVYFASTSAPDPNKLKWWHWKDSNRRYQSRQIS